MRMIYAMDLVKLKDASEVEIGGIQEEQIYVEFDNARLADLGLTTMQLQNILASTNIVFSGGEVSLEDERIVLEPTGNFESLEDLGNTPIPVGQQGATVELGDITTISRGYKSPTDRLVKVNGKEGLVIAVALKEGANLIRLGEVVDEKVREYNETLPVGLKLTRTAAQDTYVDFKVKDFVSNVIQSIFIVLAVMLSFPRVENRFSSGKPNPNGHGDDFVSDEFFRNWSKSGFPGCLDHGPWNAR